jgi:hypothetical protein
LAFWFRYVPTLLPWFTVGLGCSLGYYRKRLLDDGSKLFEKVLGSLVDKGILGL